MLSPWAYLILRGQAYHAVLPLALAYVKHSRWSVSVPSQFSVHQHSAACFRFFRSTCWPLENITFAAVEIGLWKICRIWTVQSYARTHKKLPFTALVWGSLQLAPIMYIEKLQKFYTLRFSSIYFSWKRSVYTMQFHQNVTKAVRFQNCISLFVLLYVPYIQ